MNEREYIADEFVETVDDPYRRVQININCSGADIERLRKAFPNEATNTERVTALITKHIPKWDGNYGVPYDTDIGPEYTIAEFEKSGSGKAVFLRWIDYMKDRYNVDKNEHALRQGVYRWRKRVHPGLSPKEIGKLLKDKKDG